MYEPKILNGYRLIYNPTYPKALKRSGYKGYVYEHIFIMEQSLGRPLLLDEDVHHLDGNRSNNHINNLIVLSHSMHAKLHQWLKTLNITSTVNKEHRCPTCGNYTPSLRHKYCSIYCATHDPKKLKRPSKDVLLNLWNIQKLSKSAIGRQYGVTPNAVIKWLRFYNILDT